MGQNAPGDTGQLVGERDRQHVAMQPLLGGFDPMLKPVALHLLGLTFTRTTHAASTNTTASGKSTAAMYASATAGVSTAASAMSSAAVLRKRGRNQSRGEQSGEKSYF